MTAPAFIMPIEYHDWTCWGCGGRHNWLDHWVCACGACNDWHCVGDCPAKHDGGFLARSADERTRYLMGRP